MEEYFDIVGDDDEVVGRATRKDVRAKGFVHRSWHCLSDVYPYSKRILGRREPGG